MNKIRLMAVFLLAFIIGCGGGGGSKVTITKADGMFSDGDYQDAQDAYVSLISSQGAPAVAGAAWCSIRLHHYAQADSFFTANAGVTPNADGYAGWSFANWALNDPTDALAHAASALGASFTALSMDSRVTANHLIWIQASSYLQLGNYTECFNKIHLLDAAYVMPTGTQYQISSALLSKLTSLGVAVAL